MENHEEWRPVPGHEGMYKVSSHGHVRSIDRIVMRSHGAPLPLKGRILRPAENKHGYQQVVLSSGQKRTVEVHTLVAAAFLGPRPDGFDVCHHDGNPRNNRVENLRYGTKGENSMDMVRHGTHNHARKSSCKHGHRLAGPNLKTYGKMRQCRACANARSALYPAGVGSTDFKPKADSYYSQIMKEGLPA